MPAMPTLPALRHRVDVFFTDPLSADFLSFYRIATAAMGLVVIAMVSPSLLDIYGAEGFIQWVVSDSLFRIPSLPSLIQVSDLLAPLGVTPDAVVIAGFALYATSLVAMLLGWRTRITAGVAWVLHFLICNTSIIFGYGVETFIHIGLFYCMLMPSAERWSLDARAGRTGHARVSAAARLSQRIIQLHLCMVYLNAGLAKGFGSDWWNGEAIWRSVMQPDFRQFDMSWLAWFPTLTLVLGWGVLVIECGYPLFIWNRRIRPYWLAATIALHAGIALFMGLWMFALAMIVMNIAGFGWEPVSAAIEAFKRARAPQPLGATGWSFRLSRVWHVAAAVRQWPSPRHRRVLR